MKICRLRAKVNRQVSRKCQHVTFSSRSRNFWFRPAVPFASRPAALTTVSIVAVSASGRKLRTPLSSRIPLGDGFDAAGHLTSPEPAGTLSSRSKISTAGCGVRLRLCNHRGSEGAEVVRFAEGLCVSVWVSRAKSAKVQDLWNFQFVRQSCKRSSFALSLI